MTDLRFSGDDYEYCFLLVYYAVLPGRDIKQHGVANQKQATFIGKILPSA
jgi:hypothetical protein